jgi:hypothetical protein
MTLALPAPVVWVYTVGVQKASSQGKIMRIYKKYGPVNRVC